MDLEIQEMITRAFTEAEAGNFDTAKSVLKDALSIFDRRMNEEASFYGEEILAEDLAEDSAVEAMVLEREGVAL